MFPAQRYQVGVDVCRRPLCAAAGPGRRCARCCGAIIVGHVEGQGRCAVERVTHEDDALEHIRAGERAHGSRDGARGVADDAADGAVTQSMDEHDHVTQEVGPGEGGQVDLVEASGVPARGAAEPALVGRDDVEAGISEQRKHLAPGEGDPGEAVQQKDERTVARRAVAGFENVEGECRGLDLSEPDAGRKGEGFECGGCGGCLVAGDCAGLGNWKPEKLFS